MRKYGLVPVMVGVTIAVFGIVLFILVRDERSQPRFYYTDPVPEMTCLYDRVRDVIVAGTCEKKVQAAK